MIKKISSNFVYVSLLAILFLVISAVSPLSDAQAQNLITNPNFAQGMTGWKLDYGSSYSTNDPTTSAPALRVTGATWASAMTDVSGLVKPGLTYTLSFSGRLSAPKVAGYVNIRMLDKNYAQLSAVNVNVATTSFASYSTKFTLPPTTKFLWIGAVKNSPVVSDYAAFTNFNLMLNTPLACGTNPSGSTYSVPGTTTTKTSAATATQCPYGGTVPTTTTTTQTASCFNGTQTLSTPVVTTVAGTPSCNAPAMCGTHASGTTYSLPTGTTSGSAIASLAQCPYGGTQATTTTVTQKYNCTNGTQTAIGSPSSTVANAGNPVCVAPYVGNGTCGAANGSQTAVKSTEDLCAEGDPSAVSGTGPWVWSCFGTTSTANCSTAGGKLSSATISSPVVYPTNHLLINSTLTAGDYPVLNQAIKTIIQDANGTAVSSLTQTVPYLAAGKSTPLTVSFTIPDNATMPAGTYQIYQGIPASSGAFEVTSITKFVVPAATLTLNEAFNDGRTALNTNVWSPFLDWTAIENGETSYYAPDEVSLIPNQGVQLRADVRAVGKQPYTTGTLASFNGFAQTYGHFEMQAKLPAGAGFWPAFWLFPLPSDNQASDTGEIDIFEYLGYDPLTIHQTLHSKGGLSENCKSGAYGNFSQAYHTYAVDWQPASVTFSIDGVACTTQTSANIEIPSWPMYIIANFGIGAAGDWAGPTNAATPFPSTYDIAYIKAWQYPGLPTYSRAGAIQNFTFSPANPNPGDKVTVTGTLVAGSKALSEGVLPKAGQPWTNHGLGWNVFGAGELLQGSTNSPAVEANGSSDFTYTFTIPANWPAGVYRSGISATTNDGVTIQSLQELVIGHPLPALPALN